MLYIDASAFTKRYVDTEERHVECVQIMSQDPDWATSRLTAIEAAGALRRIHPSRLDVINLIEELDADLMESILVDVDRATLAFAREISLETQVKALDAIHIASALRLKDARPGFLTYDVQQARAATEVGLTLAR